MGDTDTHKRAVEKTTNAQKLIGGKKLKQHSAKIYYIAQLSYVPISRGCLSFMNKFYLSKRKEHGYTNVLPIEREREKERRSLAEDDVRIYNRRSTPKYRNYTTREPQLLDII